MLLTSNYAFAGFIDTHLHIQAGSSKQQTSQIPAELKKRLQQVPPQRRKMMMNEFKAMQKKKQGQSADSSDALLELMQAHDVSKAVIVTVPNKSKNKSRSSTPQYLEYIKVAKKHPDKLFVMAGGDILGTLIQKTNSNYVSRKTKEKFTIQAKQIIQNGAIGFGEMIVHHLCMSAKHSYQEIDPSHPLMLALSDTAAELQVPIDIHMEALPKKIRTPNNLREVCSQNPRILNENISKLEKLLAHNRKTNIVWQHIGWDNIGYMTPELLSGLLEKHPNLYLSIRVEDRPNQVATSAPMPNRIVDSAYQIKDKWLALFQKYPDRFMVGGDEFVLGKNSDRQFPKSFESTWEVVSKLPHDLKFKIGQENAARVYHLE